LRVSRSHRGPASAQDRLLGGVGADLYRVLTVSLHALGCERLAFWLSDDGAVEVLRGDPRWFDFDLVLTTPDGRLVNRGEPLPWALALQRAYARTPLAVTLVESVAPRAAADRPQPRTSAGRTLVRALGAAVICTVAVLGACLTFAAGNVAPSIARSETFTLASAQRSGRRWAAQPPDVVPGAPALRSPLAHAVGQGMMELAGLSQASSIVSWDPSTGLWGAHSPWGASQSPAWWQSALAIWALARYLRATDSTDRRYQRVLDQTFELDVARPGTHMPVNFANQFMDDTGWWGLAWLAAARYELDVRHDDAEAARFLAVSESDAGYIAAQPRSCGGIVWKLGTQPDTVANAEFIALTAQLYSVRHASGAFHDDKLASEWLADADWVLGWLKSSGLVDMANGTVLDRLDALCDAQDGPLTYTEGEVADALIQLGSATGDPSYFGAARAFLGYTLSPQSGMVSTDGVLQEWCETRPNRCRGVGEFNSASFKGIFVQAVADYDQATDSGTYAGYLAAQAQAILRDDVSDGQGSRERCDSPHDCQFGFYWSTAVDPASAPVGVSLATQISALDALTAALSAE